MEHEMNTRNIAVPEELCRRAEEKFADRFSSTDELIVFLLRELLRNDALKMDEQEQKIIEERLRGLGYV
jgi:Arc/MetJ-type ribon-helix-helix transcriptional regulator